MTTWPQGSLGQTRRHQPAAVPVSLEDLETLFKGLLFSQSKSDNRRQVERRMVCRNLVDRDNFSSVFGLTSGSAG